MTLRTIRILSLLYLSLVSAAGQAILQGIPNPSSPGQSVTLIAFNVSVSGEVYFFDITSGTTYLGQAPAVQGTATLLYTFQAPGKFTLLACNTFDPTDPNATCTNYSQNVVTNATVTLSAMPTDFGPFAGQPVTLTATVAFPNVPNPPGTITFADGATPLSTGPVRLSAGSASLVTTFSAGTHNLTATWDGGGLFPVATASFTLVVNQRFMTPTTTRLSVSSATSHVGQPTVLTGSVSPSSATGTVTFMDGGNSVGTAALTAGTAVLVTSGLSVGTHSLTASYSGDSNFAGSASSPVTVIVFAQSCGADLAGGKPATQSSTLPGFPSAIASAAADCNTDGSFYDNSVSSTNLEASPWWQVDLGVSSSINSIVIWNRTDCCSSRLSDYWVFVSDTPFNTTDTPATLQFRPGTFSSHQTSAPNPSASISVTAQGRYVRVQLSGTDYLSLAEVQVFSVPVPGTTDLAQGKPASQSSTFPGAPSAVAAVDGNPDGNYFDGSVTATNFDTNAWWQVDLGSSTAIGSIKIWNRTDCCGDRLSDYWVFVSDTPFLTTDTPGTLQPRTGTWSSHQTSSPSPATTITAPTQGRYVRVQLTSTNYLSLAEVQVFPPSPSTNLSLGKPAMQSSTLAGHSSAVASAGVDGEPGGAFYDGVVTATNLESNPWWEVDLGAPADVSSVVLWNRTDCCASRLGDYWLFVSNTPFSPADTPETLRTRSGTFSSHQTVAPSPSISIPVGTQGRFVRVQLSGTDYLSLAEVQVLGTPASSEITNLARGKHATQSSVLRGSPARTADAAVDGDADGRIAHGSVAATQTEPNPWWQVDLGASKKVDSLVIWNRTDPAFTHPAEYCVFVSDTPFDPGDTPANLQLRTGTWSARVNGTGRSAIVPVQAQGRYVRIQLEGVTHLHLAEVQVIGQ
ncbi:MAG TPA: discoidin domain-containing protein [Bryobacteraceae bacterium]|nr:discoidin domain-containing protein [Bryobacteraceae bacterium]